MTFAELKAALEGLTPEQLTEACGLLGSAAAMAEAFGVQPEEFLREMRRRTGM